MGIQTFIQKIKKSSNRHPKSQRASFVVGFQKKTIAKIFISYSKDEKFAKQIQKKLRENNIYAWYDEDIPKDNKNYHEMIDTQIENLDILLLILDKHSMESHYVTYEWAFAWGKGKEIILLKKEECEMHERLSAWNFIDFRNRCKWKELINAIKLIRNK